MPLLCCGHPRAGKIPRLYIADGLGAIPYRLQEGVLCAEGTRHANLWNLIYNTTKQERLNGEIDCRFKSARGINEKASLISR